jgi:hypothetical protein
VSRRRIQNILLKEWELLFTDINSLLIVTLLPLLIVGQAILYFWLAFRFGGESMLGVSVFQTALQNIANAIPQVAQLSTDNQLLLLLLHQFNFFLLLIPTMIAVNVATFSIVDEKLTGSLGALLATPVRTWELLLGKALAGAIPALVMTWISAGVFLVIVSLIGWSDLSNFLISGTWFLSLFLLTPSVAVLSFMLGVIGSSRAKDSRSAQYWSLAIIFPVLILIGLQITGIVWFTPLLTLILAIGICLVSIVVLRIASRLFQRETITITWQ